MNVMCVLGEAATSHPDGTFSFLRGGIERVWGPEPPFVFEGAIIVRFRAEPSETGSHEWHLRVIDEDGHYVAPDLAGEFVVPENGGGGQFVASFSVRFKKYGRHSFRIAVDDKLMEEWPLDVTSSPQTAHAPPSATGCTGRILSPDIAEDAADLALMASRRNEPSLSHEEVKARLRRDGLLPD